MQSIGIDIGSTATKCVVLELEPDGRENDRHGREELLHAAVIPTGFSGVDAANRVMEDLLDQGFDPSRCPVVATGYGRVAVPFATKTVTEITCHALGAAHLFEPDGVVIDIGGQDTKVIQLSSGRVHKFAMNDKCSAGTGKFLEVMSTRMGVDLPHLESLAAEGQPTPISSMCTVFAESEVIGMIGRGEPIENIANGVIESVVARVIALAKQVHAPEKSHFLTGGLCDNAYIRERLAAGLGRPVISCPNARFAGAIGAALSAR